MEDANWSKTLGIPVRDEKNDKTTDERKSSVGELNDVPNGAWAKTFGIPDVSLYRKSRDRDSSGSKSDMSKIEIPSVYDD